MYFWQAKEYIALVTYCTQMNRIDYNTNIDSVVENKYDTLLEIETSKLFASALQFQPV